MSAAAYSKFQPARRIPSAKPLDVLVPAYWELGALGGLILFYLVGDSIFGDDAYFIINPVGSLWLALVLFLGAFRMAQINPVAIWLGLFWFRISTAVYFGVGSMTQLFFNAATLAQMQVFFFMQPEHLFKINLIFAVSCLLVFAAAIVLGAAFKPKPPAPVTTGEDKILWLCMIVFMTIGYLVKYLIVLPYNFGFFGNIVLPNVLIMLGTFAVVALFLLSTWCLRFAPKLFFIPTALLLLDMLVGLIQFTKGQVLLPLIVYILALLQSRTSPKRLLIAAAAVILVYQSLQPAVDFGRGQIQLRYGNISEGGLGERLEILTLFATGAGSVAADDDIQGALSRISYSSSAAAAVALYDSGRPGDSLKDVFIIFIPRSLWPEKPIMDGGSRFNQMVTGYAGSASWMGIFSEAYWNFGWTGLPVVMFPLACAYFFLGRLTISIMSQRKWLHFPIVLLGIFMGMRTDGEVVTDQAASAGICLILYVFANVADRLLRSFLESKRRTA